MSGPGLDFFIRRAASLSQYRQFMRAVGNLRQQDAAMAADVRERVQAEFRMQADETDRMQVSREPWYMY